MVFKQGKLIVQAGLAAAGIVAFAAVWFDTANYRRVVSEVRDAQNQERVAVMAQHLSEDLQRLASCNNTRRENSRTGEIEWADSARECWLKAMNQNKTTMGALAYGSFATMWLAQHPSDADMRMAAVAAIAAGRAELADSKKVYYEPQQRLLDAHDTSFLMRLIDGRAAKPDLSLHYAEKLDKAELEVLLPSVAARQRQWVLQALRPSH